MRGHITSWAAGMETGITTREERSMGKKLRANKQQRGTMLQEQNVRHALNLLKNTMPQTCRRAKKNHQHWMQNDAGNRMNGARAKRRYLRVEQQYKFPTQIRRNSHTSRMALAGPEYVCVETSTTRQTYSACKAHAHAGKGNSIILQI